MIAVTVAVIIVYISTFQFDFEDLKEQFHGSL